MPLLLALSDLYAVRGAYDQANSMLDLALANWPSSADVYLARANLATQQGLWTEAFAAFEQAIFFAPTDPGVYLAYGNGLVGKRPFSRRDKCV